MKTLMLVLALVLALSLFAAGLALANGSVERPREVLSGGAAAESAAGEVSLRATLGQPVVGVVSAPGDITLGHGFWHGGAEYRTYLPLVVRGGGP